MKLFRRRHRDRPYDPGPRYRICQGGPGCPDAWAYPNGRTHYHYITPPPAPYDARKHQSYY